MDESLTLVCFNMTLILSALSPFRVCVFLFPLVTCYVMVAVFLFVVVIVDGDDDDDDDVEYA